MCALSDHLLLPSLTVRSSGGLLGPSLCNRGVFAKGYVGSNQSSGRFLGFASWSVVSAAGFVCVTEAVAGLPEPARKDRERRADGLTTLDRSLRGADIGA